VHSLPLAEFQSCRQRLINLGDTASVGEQRPRGMTQPL